MNNEILSQEKKSTLWWKSDADLDELFWVNSRVRWFDIPIPIDSITLFRKAGNKDIYEMHSDSL